MRKYGIGIVALLMIISLFSGIGQAFVFTDPTDLYSTVIRDQWVYQSHHSTDKITVFYGEGDHDLLYFEHVGPVPDVSSRDFAERSLALHGQAGGLDEFEVEEPLEEIVVAGVLGLASRYSYLDSQKNKLWEYRIFLVLPNNNGFSIALSSNEAWVFDNSPLLDGVLSHWRWLF